MKQGLTIGIIFIIIVISIFIYNTIVNKQEEVPRMEKYSDISKSILEKNFPSHYGGSFIDSNGILNINWVGDNEEEVKNLIKNSEVIVNKVQFTLNCLNEIKLSLRRNMSELNIKYMFVGIEENRVLIFVKDFTQVKKIKEIVNLDAIQIVKTDAEIIYDDVK